MISPIRIEQPTTFAIGTMNSYLFLEPEPVLVDCSVYSQDALTSLISGLSSHGLKLSDLKRVIITHAHSDHMGLLGPICEQSQADIWVNPITRPWATDFWPRWGRRADLAASTLRRCGYPEAMVEGADRYIRTVLPTFWSAADPARLVDFPLEGTIDFGGRSWQVLYTPGHAASHTAFYQPQEQIILSADVLLPRIPMPLMEEEPHDPAVRMPGLPHLRRSLARLGGLPIKTAYPGHGPPLTNAAVIIREQLSRIEKRRGRCRAIVAGGRQTVFEVTRLLYENILQVNPYFAACLTLGYLDLLEEHREVIKQEVGGVWRYSIPERGGSPES